MKARIGITVTPCVRDEDRLVDEINRSYVRAVQGAGGLPIVLPVLPPEDVDDVLGTLDGLLLSGGGDIEPVRYGQEAVPEVEGVDRGRDAWELPLAREAFRRSVPVLGVCRGIQVLNVALGGSLVQHLGAVTRQPHQERVRFAEEIHAVELAPASRVAEAMGRTSVRVNTLHHQAVDAVGHGLRVVGMSDDGVIEAVEASDGRPALGVQWHPELLTSLPEHAGLFTWLVTEAGRRLDRAGATPLSPVGLVGDTAAPSRAAEAVA